MNIHKMLILSFLVLLFSCNDKKVESTDKVNFTENQLELLKEYGLPDEIKNEQGVVWLYLPTKPTRRNEPFRVKIEFSTDGRVIESITEINGGRRVTNVTHKFIPAKESKTIDYKVIDSLDLAKQAMSTIETY